MTLQAVEDILRQKDLEFVQKRDKEENQQVHQLIESLEKEWNDLIQLITEKKELKNLIIFSDFSEEIKKTKEMALILKKATSNILIRSKPWVNLEICVSP